MLSRSSHSFTVLKTALALVALAALSACASDNGGPITAPTTLSPQKVGASPRVYRISIGDKLKVTVFGEKDLSGDFEVNARGNVPMPLIGDVRAKGKSVREFQGAVEAKLAAGYLNNPKVSIAILNYRPFFIHGEVRSGGQFPFKSGLKLRDAIAIAGGYSYRADKSYALIIREGSRREKKIRLPTTMTVLPGDNIRIPERFF